MHTLEKVTISPNNLRLVTEATHDLQLPIDKEVVFYDEDLVQEIRRGIDSSAGDSGLAEELNDKIQTNGCVIIDGMFPDGINQLGLTAENLAPIDMKENRAYDFNTALLQQQLRTALVVGSLLGMPYRMYDAKRLIIPVTAYSSFDPSKFGGMGPNLLHKDGGFLAPLQPDNLEPIRRGPGTDISALLSINQDRTGFGKSWFAPENTSVALEYFSEDEQDILREPVYSYLPAHGLNDAVGLDVFPILYDDKDGNSHFRFSGKLIEHISRNPDAIHTTDKGLRKDAPLVLQKLNEVLMKGMSVFHVMPGELFLSDQHRTFHGREEVHDPNRLLAQFFLRFY